MTEMTELVACKIPGPEKEIWAKTAESLGITLSDFVRNSVRAAMEERPALRAMRLADEIRARVTEKYSALVARLDEEIARAEGNLARLEEDLAKLAAEIEALAAPPQPDEAPEDISQKLEELAKKRTLKEAFQLKREQMIAYIAELRERRKRLLNRQEREILRALRAEFPAVFVPIMNKLVEDVTEAARGLSPFLVPFYERERPTVLYRWLWLFLSVQCRKRGGEEAWRLVGCGQPFMPSNYETAETFLEFWSNFCGPIGPAAHGEAESDTVSVAER